MLQLLFIRDQIRYCKMNGVRLTNLLPLPKTLREKKHSLNQKKKQTQQRSKSQIFTWENSKSKQQQPQYSPAPPLPFSPLVTPRAGSKTFPAAPQSTLLYHPKTPRSNHLKNLKFEKFRFSPISEEIEVKKWKKFHGEKRKSSHNPNIYFFEKQKTLWQFEVVDKKCDAEVAGGSRFQFCEISAWPDEPHFGHRVQLCRKM